MTNKVSYLESNGQYLIMKEDGSSLVLKSEKEFNEYLTTNKCDVVN